jgi:Zn-dependent M28 family amino/carboxypeptidase
MRPGAEDPIFNGANDNASGVAALIEAASALTTVEPRPKRSILFLAVFGEEKGLLGSREYTRHPAVPLDKTVGVLSLEALGRTDAEDGPHTNRVAMTGFGYSTITATLVEAGRELGVEVYKHEQNSDVFFTRSDNASFAEKGIPAHTLSTGYLYADYHRPGDHWDKLDYPHVEKITRSLVLGLLKLADNPVAPKWDMENPRVDRFLEAARKLASQAGQ